MLKARFLFDDFGVEVRATAPGTNDVKLCKLRAASA